MQYLQPWREIWPAAQPLEYQDEAAVRREPPMADDQRRPHADLYAVLTNTHEKRNRDQGEEVAGDVYRGVRCHIGPPLYWCMAPTRLRLALRVAAPRAPPLR